MVLEDVSSHEALTFDFQGWVGEVGGDIRKELPLVKKDKTHKGSMYCVCEGFFVTDKTY